MQTEINGRLLELLQGDITHQETDAIVNAANSGLSGGGGVDGAIHRAGGPEIMIECRKLGGCPTGSACITTAGSLKARYVIHAVGPVWRGGNNGEAPLLEGAYKKCLAIADEKQLLTISFPSLSTGTYRYPVNQAAEIALATVINHLRGGTSLSEAAFVLFNKETFNAYKGALGKLMGWKG